MQKDRFERIISFLLGASWAIMLFGALITFKIFLFMGLATTLFFTLLFIIFTLLLMLLLDAFLVNKQRLAEAKKQTKLLEKIVSESTL